VLALSACVPRPQGPGDLLPDREKRITGLRWLEIRRRGSAWVVQQFMAQCKVGRVVCHNEVSDNRREAASVLSL